MLHLGGGTHRLAGTTGRLERQAAAGVGEATDPGAAVSVDRCAVPREQETDTGRAAAEPEEYAETLVYQRGGPCFQVSIEGGETIGELLRAAGDDGTSGITFEVLSGEVSGEIGEFGGGEATGVGG